MNGVMSRVMGKRLRTRLTGSRMRSRARKGTAPSGVRRSRKARNRRTAGSKRIKQALKAFWGGDPPVVSDRPYDLIRDLAGSVSGGPPDLGARHREYLRGLIRDRR